MTTGQLASAIQQRGLITGATLNRTTAWVAVAGQRGNVESLSTRSHVAAARGGCGVMTTGRLASASQRGTVTGADKNGTTAPAVAGQDGRSIIGPTKLTTHCG